MRGGALVGFPVGMVVGTSGWCWRLLHDCCIVWVRQKKHINRRPMSNFHSLSTYVDCTNFKSYFPRLWGRDYFLFLHLFMIFFIEKLIGSCRNLVWFGGVPK